MKSLFSQFMNISLKFVSYPVRAVDGRKGKSMLFKKANVVNAFYDNTIRNVFLKLTTISLSIVFSGMHTTAQAVELINQCRTIDKPGAYRLTANLNAEADCLVVTTDYVSIDLDGHVIQGNNIGAGVVDDKTFRNGMQTGLVVRNGTVTGFRNGISFDRTEGAIIENMTVSDNDSYGISVTAGKISGNLVYRNGFNGIEADRDSIVSNNLVSYSGRNGIQAGAASVVRDHSVHLNERTGIRSGGTGLVMTNNSSTSNGDDGVSVACPSAIIANAMNRNNMNRNDSVNFRRSGSGCVVSQDATK